MIDRGKSFEGRSIAVFGGAGDIGLKACVAFALQGAEAVHIGTRDPEKLEKSKARFGRRNGLDMSTLPLHTLVADVTEKAQISAAVKKIKGNGGEVTDAVFSQASGMERFSKALFNKHLDGITEYTFDTPIEELPVDQRVIVENKLAAMRRDLVIWTADALPHAIAVNSQGTFNGIEVLAEEFPGFKRGVFINSTWGELSGQPGVEIPHIYRAVDMSKAVARDRINAEAPELAKQGIRLSKVIASLVPEGPVGKMFVDFLFNLTEKRARQALKDSAIPGWEVVRGLMIPLTTPTEQWPADPYDIFAYTDNGQTVFSPTMKLSEMYAVTYKY